MVKFVDIPESDKERERERQRERAQQRLQEFGESDDEREEPATMENHGRGKGTYRPSVDTGNMGAAGEEDGGEEDDFGMAQSKHSTAIDRCCRIT